MKKVIALFVFFMMLLTFVPVKASDLNIQKLNPVFLQEVSNSNRLVSVMVELMDDPVVVYSQNTYQQKAYYQKDLFEYGTNGEDNYRPNLINQQNQFLQKLAKQNISYFLKYRCTDVLNSIAMEVKGSDLPKIAKIADIKRIYDDRMEFYPMRAIATETTGARSVWKGIGSLGKITGKGVLVGVLDTGLDKKHMKSGEFAGRVEGGYDFADGDGDFDDNGPIGHGTHVAGIIGGKGKSEDYQGMAYEAKFRIYKVFSSKGGGGRGVGEAIDRSVREKCKVINMSLGSEGDASITAKNNPYYGTIVTNAAKAGTIVVASAGNSGARGQSQPFPAGSPGIAEDAFCIAATNDRPITTFKVKIETVDRNIQINEASGTPAFDQALSNLKIVSCGYGNPEDFQEEVEGNIALIQRGPKGNDKMTFRYKMDNAIENGAKAVLLYNHTPGEVMTPAVFVNVDPSTVKSIPVAMMTNADGLWLLTVLDKSYQITFDKASQNSVASFSSMGPTPDGFFKPEITAPGSEIYSTYKDGGYLPMSGTSMSSPAVTGLVALLKQAYPKWDTNQVKSALMNTAEILINPINQIPVTFLLQGAGEARIDRALVTPALISPRALVVQKDLIQPGAIKPDKEIVFTLESNSSVNQTFPLSYQVFGTSDENNFIKINFQQDSVVLPTGQKTTFTIRYDIDWNSLTKYSYEGIIQVGNDLHIPFVVFRDSVLRLPEVISDISIAKKELILSKDAEEDIKIKFSLNLGAEYKTQAVAGGSDYHNYASIEMYVSDEAGEKWGTLTYLTNYLIGDYEYHWDGKAMDGKYFLPKGKYFIQFKIMGSNYDSKENPDYVYYNSSKKEESKIDVTESSVPDPSPIVISCNKIVQMNDIFLVNLIIPDAKNCIGVDLNLTYDAKKLICKDIVETEILSSDGVSITFDQTIDDNKGLIHASILRDENIGISLNNAIIMQITFKAIDTGKLKFSMQSSKILFADESIGKLKGIFPNVRISKLDDFLMADLNDDKVVDRYDWVMFMEACPSKAGEVNYNSECDFNQDQLVNFDDFLIFSKEYSRSI